MSRWTKPENISQWMRRVFSLLNVGTVLVVALLVISELRFDWAERVVGGYLTTTNAKRPESGAIWEKGKEARTAQKRLHRIVTDRLSSQHDAREAESFRELASFILPGQWVMLSPDHFRKMYLKLPAPISREVIDPLPLLALYTEKEWDRAYFERAGEGLFVYLLDNRNRVLKQLTIGSELLRLPEEKRGPTPGVLEDYPGLRRGIYGGPEFFKALAGLPAEVRNEVVVRPLALLRSGGPVGRVGISDEVKSGFVELGFEIETDEGTGVLLSGARTWAVWRLSAELSAMVKRDDPDGI